jgi:hypothetical protein
MRVPLVSRLRHYRGLARTYPRLERMLDEFRFTSVARHYRLDEGGQFDVASFAVTA